MASREIQIHGYAIVSDDDRIADASGQTPPSLRNDADWAYFQSELDRADFVALGRLGHEANPNVKRRRRLVLSSAASGPRAARRRLVVEPRENGHGTRSAAALLPNGGRVAVPGGQAVFDLFVSLGYHAFHLSRAHGVPLRRADENCLPPASRGVSAEAVAARRQGCAPTRRNDGRRR